MGPEAVLFSEMVPGEDFEEAFNAWYDEEHIPLRLAIPGFVRGTRYLSTADPRRYLAVYELSGTDVLETPAYRSVKTVPSERTSWMLGHVTGFTRYTGELVGAATRPDVPRPWEAPFVYPVFFSIPEAHAAAFDAWYDLDHVPTLLKEPRWMGCRRYRIRSGEPEAYTHLALHQLSDASALESPYRAMARRSPWRDALASQDWFKGTYHVFRRLDAPGGSGR